ncbi:Na/Pi symporter [Corynebacterium lubricantis]|uniref:Na/Pi symporter n=1 Tax=Corynebacterium lubricantis TaxID=541095 RepID=UPI00037D1FA6|nr:Na/Pi symporter [Corynebacterium lubricantis]
MPGPGTVSDVFPIKYGTDRVALSAAGKAARIAAIVGAVLLLVLSVYLVAQGVNDVGQSSAQAIFDLAENPLVGLAVGLLVTAVVQSSSTTTALTVAAVATGVIGLETAIPIILGANIGTTVTPLIVSFSYAHNKEAFRIAHSTAAMHMWFNTIMVAIIFPIEAIFGVVRRLLPAVEIQGEALRLEPFTELVQFIPLHGGWSILVGAVSLLISIRIIDSQLRHLLTPLAWIILGHSTHRSSLAGFGAGFLLTILIQASAATISAILPFATAKLSDARGYLSIILGANVGTTFLAVLTAYATPGDYPILASQVAFVHVAFNVVGALAVAVLRPLRKLIYKLADFSGRIAERSTLAAFTYMSFFYFVIPALVIAIFTLAS